MGGKGVRMQLNEAQRAILIAIESEPKALPHFDFLCSALGAALGDIDDDPERTNPFGAKKLPELEEAANVIAVAWLETVAQAMELEGGALSEAAIDEDGIPAFIDDSALFAVADACGYGKTHLRAAIKRVRGGSRLLPHRFLLVLTHIRVYCQEKRRTAFRGASRLARLPAGVARSLEKSEIGRAKAGNIYYSLVAKNGAYEAERTRRVVMRGEGGGESKPATSTDDIDGFSIPLFPCDEAHPTAVAQFAQFLDERGYTYQRLVHR